MENEFSNREISIKDLPQFEAIDYHQVSTKLRTKALLQALAQLIITGIILTVLVFMDNEVSILLLVGGGLLLFFIIRIADIILRQKYYGYAFREKDLAYRRGYLINQVTVIPFNRIQHSSIRRSLLDKAFGIASLKIYTAGGSGSDIEIPGLELNIAENLNEALSKKVADYEH